MKKQEADLEANALLVEELGEKAADVFHDQLRELGFSSYAVYYMFKKRDVKTLTNSANLDTILKFAKFDQALGTTIPELILYCCRHAPKKEFIKKLFSLDTTSDKATAVKKVLDYTDKIGSNCLMNCFDLAVGYSQETGDLPELTTGMMAEIENTIQFLIKLGNMKRVDMKSVLNHTTKEGSTLFLLASYYSEKLTYQLLHRRVDVKTVNFSFLTPSFRVSK